ncbi:MAG: hypothetical protein E6H59_03650, partial [Betaproteobacteria bacterium]
RGTTMYTVVRQIILLAFSSAAAVFSSSVLGDYVANQIDYTDPSNGSVANFTQLWSINNKGNALGVASFDGGVTIFGFVYDPATGNYVRLPLPPGIDGITSFASPIGINDAGVITGTTFEPIGSRGFILKEGVYTFFSIPGWADTGARTIGNPTAAHPEGLVVGYVDETRKPGTGKTAEFCPSLWGGKNWPPAAYSPQTRLLYIPANDNLCTQLTGEAPKYVQGERFMGVAKNVLKMVAGADHIGELQAWNLDTGKKVWTTNMPSFNWGPVLATGGGLLFAGGTNDRMFRAFDARTGKVLWEFPTGSGVAGVPVSFQVDGKQYVAVQSGWGVDPAKMQTRMNLIFPGQYPDVPQGGAVWVFAVK